MNTPIAPVNTSLSLGDDPQFQARDMIVKVEDDRLDGPLLVPGVTPKLSRTPGRVPPLGRALGADTEAIRRRIGRTRDGDWVAALRPSESDDALERIGLSRE